MISTVSWALQRSPTKYSHRRELHMNSAVAASSPSSTVSWQGLGAIMAAVVLAATLVVAPTPIPLLDINEVGAHPAPQVCERVTRYAGYTADGQPYGRYTTTVCRPGAHVPHFNVPKAAESVGTAAATYVAGLLCGPVCATAVFLTALLVTSMEPQPNPTCNPAKTGIANCPR